MSHINKILNNIMKNLKTYIIAGGIFLIALLFIPKILGSKENSNKKFDTKKINAMSVNYYVAKPEILENTVYSSGTILGNEEVELRSEISGKINKIYFQEGSRVKKNELLIKINDAELQAQLKKAKSTLELAEYKEYRQKKLLEVEAISQEDYDVALNELKTNQAEIELLQAQIDKTEIRAPFDGIIGLKYVSEGSYITPNNIIATLQNINPVKIDFSIPERYAGIVKKGDKIVFTIESNNEEFEGEVYAIEPKIDLATRSLLIRGIYKNPNSRILPGSFAHIKLVLENINNALMVPSEAVIPDLKSHKVFIYNNGKAIARQVNLGIRTERKVQIINGIQPNDTIITTGLLQIKDNLPINLIN